MARTEIYLPAMGEGVIEATITKWLVNVGEKVEEDDSLVEVATDKVDSEIPAPASGLVKELLLNEGDIPKVGDILMILETEGGADLTDKNVQAETAHKPQTQAAAVQGTPVQTKTNIPGISPAAKRTGSGTFLSPLVRKIAAEEGISIKELDSIKGSGSLGRLTKRDILSYIESPHKNNAEAKIQEVTASPDESQSIIEMGRMRSLIAEHMVRSKHTSPHVTSFIEADVSSMVKWREANKQDFLEKYGEKITYTALFLEAIAKALRDHPMINISVDGNKIILKHKINIGMAAALPDGNLIVPVIKDADEKNLPGMARAVNDLATRARGSKLKPGEIQGGSFTITNFGSFDNLTGTPIINQPEAAILGIGAIIKKPAVIETDKGDAIAIRHIMMLSLSYDHRVIDGALGGTFLRSVKEYLEAFDIKR